ncbi:MAG: arsenite S-adenosylmethyltransferase [Methanobacterium sp.]|nr:MAG: arsenite S-adenosylmethyltransferase [Methanobacterium sp.]
MKEDEIKKLVKNRYSKIASQEKNSFSCCSTDNSIYEQAKSAGYSSEELKSIPESAIYGLGCGNPTALAGLKEGDVVLDLGSGGGIDVFLAAHKVGKRGKVIGVDMTMEMVEKGRENAKKGAYENVEFLLGEIEALPMKSNEVDVIISNCVINLIPDKYRAYKESYRVLKPSGKLMVSDLVTDGYLPEDIKRNFQAWSDCISGALEKEEYLNIIKKAGFKDVKVLKQHYFREPEMDERLIGKIISIQLKASK